MMSRVITGTMTSFIRDVKRIFGFVKWSVKRPSVSFIPTIIMETGMHTFARVVTMLRAYSGSLMRAKSMMMETTAEIVRTLMKGRMAFLNVTFPLNFFRPKLNCMMAIM